MHAKKHNFNEPLCGAHLHTIDEEHMKDGQLVNEEEVQLSMGVTYQTMECIYASTQSSRFDQRARMKFHVDWMAYHLDSSK